MSRRTKMYFLGLTAFVVISIEANFAFPAEQSAISQDACSLDSARELLDLDLKTSSPITLDFSGKSSEGGTAKIYNRDGKTVFIYVEIFGETSRQDIKYYFDADRENRYLVELTVHNYVSPVYESKGKVASTESASFVVCEEKKPNYPNSSDLSHFYQEVQTVLAAIPRLN